MPQTYPAAVAAKTLELTAAYQAAWAHVIAEQQRVALGLVTNPRLWRQRDRLVEIRQRIELEMANVDALAQGWVSREYPRFYMAGAEQAATKLASPFQWTQNHRDAVVLAASDTMDDLLEATAFVREDTKRFLREVIRREVVKDQLVGRTAVQTSRNVTRYLEARGIHAVRYANGARVGLATYAEMAVRTKTAVAYNVGSLNQGAEFGVKFYEVFDGPSCGWTSHSDVDLANGSIRSAQEAATFVIAHPRCARSFGPRPDIQTKPQAKKAEPTAGGQAKDRPEAAGRPLEAAARTKASREAAVSRRTQAGLQARIRTPQRVLDRRAAMFQKVRLPAARLPGTRPPGQGQQPPPPSRSALGENLEVLSPEGDPIVARHLADLDLVPAHIHAQMRASGVRVQLKAGNVTDFPGLEIYKGMVPRGWEGTGKGWEDVPGLFHVESQRVIAGGVEGVVGHGTKSLVLHEYGHGVDAAYGVLRGVPGVGHWNRKLLSGHPEWRAIHADVEDLLKPYYRQADEAGPEELFAEGFSRWTQDGKEGLMDLFTSRDGYGRELLRVQRAVDAADEFFTRQLAAAAE